MIACPIPDQDNATSWKLLEKVGQEGNSGFRVSGFVRLNQALLGEQVYHSIVSLFVSFVQHRHFDAFAGFALDIAAHIAPQQMAFILEKHHHLL
jgi:hypothetical protein